MAEPVSALLRRSLDHLATEVPASYRRVLAELGQLVVALDVDGERFTVRGGGRLEVDDGTSGRIGAWVRTSRAAVLDVLDGEVALHEAVEADRVHVQGSLDDVVQAHDALLAYASAAVRAPSAPGLLAALREGMSRR